MEGVIIRAGYRGYFAGNIKTDVKAVRNIQGAVQYGIPLGLYFMSQAVTKEEAEFCLNLVDGMDLALPIYYDSEWSGAGGHSGRADGLTKEQRSLMAKNFVETVNAGGWGRINDIQGWVCLKYVSRG